MAASTINGLDYLNAAQNANGSWGGTGNLLNDVFPTTANALRALQLEEQSPSPSQTKAIQFLNSQVVNVVPYLAERIIALADTNSDLTIDVTTLLSTQNLDGGWGTDAGFQSDVFDTSLSLQALKAAGVTNLEVIANGINYLIDNQHADGSWGLLSQGDGHIFYTALALQTLDGYAVQFSLVSNQQQALAYLRSKQNADGGYGSPTSTPFETAQVLLASLGTSKPLTSAETAARTYLEGQQLANGSWADDAYSTALALLALSFPLDSDGDGMSDECETANTLNLTDPADAVSDTDGDGLANLEECRRGTNARAADTDGDGGSDEVEVANGSDPLDPNDLNRQPTITSQPVTSATEQQAYHYQLAASDPDGDALTFTLLHAPAGMSVSASGLLAWTPTTAQVGASNVSVQASDGRGGAIVQPYRVTVLAQGIDLAIASVDINGLSTNLQTLVAIGMVPVELQNRGGSPFSGSFEVLLFEDHNDNGSFEPSDLVLGSETFAGAIDSNGSATLAVPLAGKVQFRDNLIYAFADSQGQIPELKEDNNLAHSGQGSQYQPPHGDFQPKVQWQWNGTAGVSHPPLVAPLIDTNQDNRIDDHDVPAVVFVSAGRLTALRGDRGDVLFTGSTGTPNLDGLITPAVGDIDGDGRPEIVAVGFNDPRLHAFNNDGTLKWSSPAVTYISNPALVDLNADGRAEILFGVSVFNADGTIRWDRGRALPGYLGGESRGHSASAQAVDLNLDGIPEIVAGPSALDRNGNLLWWWQWQSFGNKAVGTLDGGATTVTLTPNANLSSQAWTTVANVDDDPNPEILVISSGGTPPPGGFNHSLWIFEHDGRLKGNPITLYRDALYPTVPEVTFRMGPPTVADLDGNGQPEIVIGTTRGTSPFTGSPLPPFIISVLRSDGSQRWQREFYPYRNSANRGSPAVTAFDFDGDGAAEVVFFDEQKLYLLNGRDGTTLFEMAVEHTLNLTTNQYASIADVDNDGNAEIIVPTYKDYLVGAPPRQGILVLGDVKDNWLHARRTWNQWMYHITNVDNDSRIPRVAQNNWQTFNNHRTQAPIEGLNPFTAPDLTVSKVTINTQSCPAGVGLSARVGNGGSLQAGTGLAINFYNGDPATGGTRIGTAYTSRVLYPGEFEDVTFNANASSTGPVFVTVNEAAAGSPVTTNNLSLLPHSWVQTNGICTNCSVLTNLNAYLGIDGIDSTLWVERPFGNSNYVSTGPSLYEVHFPYGVNVTGVTIKNTGASTTGFLSGALLLSNGFSTPVTFNANGEGSVSFAEQTNISWVQITGATTKANGASLSEFIVAGSHAEPPFRLNEGTGRPVNNKAASAGPATCQATANQSPQISSAPPLSAQVGSLYAYAAQATDPEGDTLTFVLDPAPAGMTMDAASGQISWTPIVAQAGAVPVTVKVSDGKGGSAQQSFTIAVRVGNRPPQITSTPSAAQLVGQSYSYSLLATDPDGDPFEFAVSQAPAGATFDQATRSIVWIPTTDQIGVQFFSVEVRDGFGGVSTQAFVVTVEPAFAALPPLPQDGDSDGFAADTDCDDAKAGVNPGTNEVPNNQLDDDCNAATPDTVSAAAVTCSIVTLKRSYAANALAQLRFTVRNLSTDFAIQGAQAQVTVSDSGGSSVFTQRLPVNALPPKGLYRATVGFDTGSLADGTYAAKLALEFGSSNLCQATASFTILSNHPPVAVDDTMTTNQDTAVVVDVLANDSDPDGETLTITSVEAPANGTATIVEGSRVSYTPNPGFSGEDSFTYSISDGNGGSTSATVNITVNAVNAAPVANDDSYSTDEDTPLTADTPGVLGNDTDADQNPLTAVKVSDPTHGTLTFNLDGSFSYTPDANFCGSDSFTYKINDGQVDSNVATVTLTVNCVNDAPVAKDDIYAANEDTSLNIDAADMLLNDTDPDGNTLTAMPVSNPTHGTLTPNTDGSFSYTPAANYNGDDSFTYKANDGQADSNVATLSIIIAAENDAPVANDDSYTTDEDRPLTVSAPGVLGNDTDVENDRLAATLVAAPAHGILTLNPDGSFSYSPDRDYNGNDSFTYQVEDGQANSTVATVNLTVNPVNDAPVANDDSDTTDEDTPLTVSAPGALGNDTDVDDAVLTALLVNGPTHGTVTLNSDGAFTYTPAANYNGSDSFTYKANDGQGDSNIATVLIEIGGLNDEPVAVNNSYTTDEDTPLKEPAPGVLGNDTDADGNPLTAILVEPPAHGAITLNLDGSFTYTPITDYNGPDRFTYQASDGTLSSNLATVDLTVNAVIDAPVANDDNYSTNEDILLEVAAPGVLDNDTDVDQNPLTAVKVSAPTHGTLVLNTDGAFIYAPNPGYHGPDSFTYKANNGATNSAIATVSVTVNAVNALPNCAAVTATPATIWSPNHQWVPVTIQGFSDPDGDPLSLTITSIFQDEPINGTGDGDTAPDGQGVGTATAQVRAERKGNGNGRVYHISFTVGDGHDGTCKGEVLVSVPKNQSKPAVDEGALYDSTGGASGISAAMADDSQAQPNRLFLPMIKR